MERVTAKVDRVVGVFTEVPVFTDALGLALRLGLLLTDGDTFADLDAVTEDSI
jgi:hypothetical protein